MMEWRRSNTGKSILPAFPNKLIGHSSLFLGGVGGAVWFKKKKKKKRYLTESPSLILMLFGKISLTKRVFLSYVGNIEILSFLFHFLCRILPSAAHRQSFRGPGRLSDLHYALVPSVDFFYIPLPFFHHGFPLIQCLRGHRRYSLCFHVGSSSVRQKKGSLSHLSQAFQDLSNVSRLFRPYQPYTLSCFSPGGNGQLPSHALGRRWAQGIFNPTLWAILAFHPPSFFPGGKISTWVLAILAFLSSPSFHNLLPRRDCHFPFSPFQRGASQPPSAFLLPVAFFFLENKRSLPTFPPSLSITRASAVVLFPRGRLPSSPAYPAPEATNLKDMSFISLSGHQSPAILKAV